MNKRIYTIDEIKAIVTPIAKKYHIESVYLFGSYARGKATEESDVDLIVNFNSDATLLTLADVMEELKTALGKSVDIISHDSAPARLLFNILDEEILMYA